MDDLTLDEVHANIDVLIADLLDEANVSAGPIDAVELATRHLNLAVPTQRDAETDEEQHQFAVARKIADHLETDLLTKLHLPLESTKRLSGLSLPKRMASRLLVPTAWLVEAGRDTDFDLLALKKQFTTASYEIIAWRLLDLDSPCVITIVDNDEVYKRRSNAVRVKRTLSPAEAECQRYVHEHGEPYEVRKDGWKVQGWPIPHREWSREILRSVVDEVD